jgi:hypothetical protein
MSMHAISAGRIPYILKRWHSKRDKSLLLFTRSIRYLLSISPMAMEVEEVEKETLSLVHACLPLDFVADEEDCIEI